MTVFRRRDFIPAGAWLHVARAVYRAGRPGPPHTHADFAEASWVERGSGAHLVNGARVALAAGDLVIVRRADRHAFAAGPEGELTFVNVAFAEGLLGDLRRRYFPAGGWTWSGGALPAVHRLGPAALARLSSWADGFGPHAQTKLEAEGFLMDLLRLTGGRPTGRIPRGGLPDWLESALHRLADGADLSGGVAELARLSGRGRAHISRVTRRIGLTPTDLVNRVRMEHAARLLRMTDRPILDIALDCGLSNLAHFYKLFKARFGATPRRYHLHQRALLP